MLSAPAAIPATRHGILRCALTPQSPHGRTYCATSSPSPARCAGAIIGTKPACDTRLRSSKDALRLRQAVQQSHCKVSSGTGYWKLQ